MGGRGASSGISDKGKKYGSEYTTLHELNYLSTYNEKDTVIRGIIEGLRGGTTYYVAAYAKNTKAISYGEVRKVRTPDVVATLPNYIGESVTEASFCVLNGILLFFRIALAEI